MGAIHKRSPSDHLLMCALFYTKHGTELNVVNNTGDGLRVNS